MSHPVGWTSFLRRPGKAAIPPCGDLDCSSRRRLWRRVRWRHGTIRLHDSVYCAPACFEAAARQRFAQLSAIPASAPPVRHRVPLGLLMISRGLLTNPQLRTALEAQREDPSGRLGEWLEHLGFATEQQVTAALAQQWACPLLSSQARCDPACLHLLPYHLLLTFRILPVQFVPATQTFHLAFCNGIDYSALYAIEQMLDCRTQACLAPRSAVDQALQFLHEGSRQERLFPGWREASEMARITCDYVLKLGAKVVRLAGCTGFIWARLSSGPDVANLLFHLTGQASQAAGFGFSVASPPPSTAG